MDQWKTELCTIVEDMIFRLTAFRESVALDSLVCTCTADLAAGVREFREHMYQAKPTLSHPIAKALWTSTDGEIRLLSCQTNFSDLKKKADCFLFALNLQLQTDHYCPPGTIKTIADLHPNRKVIIYGPQRDDVLSAAVKAVAKWMAPFKRAEDLTPVVARGPISLSDGSVYTGEWDASNTPD